jgi:hypothetical protein
MISYTLTLQSALPRSDQPDKGRGVGAQLMADVSSMLLSTELAVQAGIKRGCAGFFSMSAKGSMSGGRWITKLSLS